MSDKKRSSTPHEFMQRLYNMHWQSKIEEELINLEMIDRLVDFMGDDLPEAEYIIQRVQRRLRNDRKY